MYKISLAFLLIALAGCTEIQVGSHLFKRSIDGKVCKAEGDLKVGAPYKVNGIRYEPIVSSLGYSERGVASWYGKDFHGKPTANGECYNMYAYTAAHKTLPLPSVVRVTNLENRKSIVLKVNDRGPFVAGRVIDLSYAAAQSLDMVGAGTAPVLVEAIGGPHHYAGGAKNNPQLLAQLPNFGRTFNKQTTTAPAPQTAPTLPSYSPPSLSSEELEPTVFSAPTTNVQTPFPAAEAAKLEATLPAPARLLPPAPSTPQTPNTSPLIRTNAYVQVGAFGSLANANAVLDKLRALEPSASLSKIPSGGQTLTRVRAGPYASLAEAEAVLARLQSAGFEAARLAIEPR